MLLDCKISMVEINITQRGYENYESLGRKEEWLTLPKDHPIAIGNDIFVSYNLDSNDTPKINLFQFEFCLLVPD